jgi:Cu(I)/Ag(I) efflux system membrane fusion protein
MENNRKKSWFHSMGVKIAFIAIISFAAGFLIKSYLQPSEAEAEHKQPTGETEEQGEKWWTCSMHTEIRLPKPGICPKCPMELIPVTTSAGDIGERQISFSEAAIKLMEIETTAVERKFVTAEIRMVGKIDYDETRVKHITAWVRGRIDRLYVDFTGVNVKNFMWILRVST